MSQMHHRKVVGAPKEWEGLLSEMEWVPWCWIGFFANDDRRRQHGVSRSAAAWGTAGFRVRVGGIGLLHPWEYLWRAW